MTVEVALEQAVSLEAYGTVPCAYTVRSRLRVVPIDGGLGGLGLVEEPVEPPWVKDYDALEGPTRWSARFDLARWAVLSARQDVARVGGAIVAWNTPGLDLLEGRDDLAVLWDLRVHPAVRRQGIASQLFGHAAHWARGRGCRRLWVETQDVNVPACRFYARQGCVLAGIQRHRYREAPDETQLLWTLGLETSCRA